jgi:UDP-N-acetylglucosamine 2-epimerase (non-hydrolysing)
VISELDKCTEHVLVHTGQNFDYELNAIFFLQLQIRKPDYFLNTAGKTAAETIANVISKSDDVFSSENPDAVLIYGDTNSCLSVIAAKRRKIPIFHMEAGNRCFDLRVPEEINRKIIDHLSDINMVISEHARRNLINEGIPQDRIFKIGSSLTEVLNHYENGITGSDILEKTGLNKNDYIVFSIHREENVDSDVNLKILIDAINTISVEFSKKIIVSMHPRTRKRYESMGYSNLNTNIVFMKPFGYFDYIKLQQNAFCVISDSGTITEESSILKFPAVTVRQSQERPEGMDEGTVIMTGLDIGNILDSIRVAVRHFKESDDPYETVQDYLAKNVSRKVVKIIFSYTNFVNRTVWYKNNL